MKVKGSLGHVMRLDVAILCTVLFAATGCTRVKSTADIVSNPVLFGPVQSLGPPVDGSKQIRAFVSETNQTITALPTGTSTSQAYIEGSAHSQMEDDVQKAMVDDKSRYIVLKTINCGAYFLFPVFMARDHTWCKVTGNLFRSHVPPPTRTVAKPQPKDGLRFDTKAARAALEASAAMASSCTSGADPAEVEVTVTFATSGAVTSVDVGGDYVAKTSEEECIVKAFGDATVPAFEGEPVTLKKKVSLGKP
jgi:hypothetical protein